MSNDQQYPYGQYGDQGHGRGQGRIPGQDDRYPGGQYPGAGGQGAQDSQGWAEPQEQGQQEQAVSQTWEGQTWDTQYQPHVQWQPGARGSSLSRRRTPTGAADAVHSADAVRPTGNGTGNSAGTRAGLSAAAVRPGLSGRRHRVLPPQAGYSPPQGAPAATRTPAPAPAPQTPSRDRERTPTGTARPPPSAAPR